MGWSQSGKLFTMFKRFHNHVEGTSIGLYIVKRIMENGGGFVEVESEQRKRVHSVYENSATIRRFRWVKTGEKLLPNVRLTGSS